jgi:hypothetical protein
MALSYVSFSALEGGSKVFFRRMDGVNSLRME